MKKSIFQFLHYIVKRTAFTTDFSIMQNKNNSNKLRLLQKTVGIFWILNITINFNFQQSKAVQSNLQRGAYQICKTG